MNKVSLGEFIHEILVRQDSPRVRKAAADIRAVAKHLQTKGMLKQEAKLLAALKVLMDALGE